MTTLPVAQPIRLADGGLETSLIADQGFELPEFAAFPLVETEAGRAALRAYYTAYLEIAGEHEVGFVLDTPTWRANPDWAARLGYDVDQVRALNRTATVQARALAQHFDDVVLQGVIGPRGDGYRVDTKMTADAAAGYHRVQIGALADEGVDVVAAITFTYSAEAIGFVQAAVAIGVPAIVSFTVETDGRLPSGEALSDAISDVDDQTGGAASGFMVNCAHPIHFAPVLDSGDWRHRIIGLRANASTLSHAELDAADAIDHGDPADLAERYRALVGKLPDLRVLGGCCGTDVRHIRAIASACLGG